MKHLTEERLSLLMDGRLPLYESKAASVHCNQCSICGRKLDELTNVRSSLRLLRRGAPSPEFWTDATRQMRVSDLNVWNSKRWKFDTRKVLATSVVIAAALTIFAGPDVIKPVPNGTYLQSPRIDIIRSQDVAAFIQAHTSSVSEQVAGDTDRQAMLGDDGDSDDFRSPDR